MDGKDQIGDRARNKVLEEAVAFANAHGGALLIGIKESDTKPPVAAEIKPLPRCAELAERLGLMFRECVEPQLPWLEVFGVPIEGKNGVVVIRVGRSRLAPHRVKPTHVCPVRRADRCDSMTMREIQDMTLTGGKFTPAVQTAGRGNGPIQGCKTLQKFASVAPRSKTTSTTNAIRTAATFSNKIALPHWPSGVNLQPESARL